MRELHIDDAVPRLECRPASGKGVIELPFLVELFGFRYYEVFTIVCDLGRMNAQQLYLGFQQLYFEGSYLK